VAGDGKLEIPLLDTTVRRCLLHVNEINADPYTLKLAFDHLTVPVCDAFSGHTDVGGQDFYLQGLAIPCIKALCILPVAQELQDLSGLGWIWSIDWGFGVIELMVR